MRTIVISVLSLMLSLTASANDGLLRAEAIAGRQLGTDCVILAKRTETCCVFSAENRGYAIVSIREGDEPRLLAFSLESRWDEAAMPQRTDGGTVMGHPRDVLAFADGGEVL